MNELISQLNTLCQNNQILSTVAGGSIVVWLVSNIKTIWEKIINGITALISFSIINTFEDTRGMASGFMTQSQQMFNEFIYSTKAIWERTQNLDLSSANEMSNFDIITYDESGDSLPTGTRKECVRRKAHISALTYGFSIRIMFGKIVFCTRVIEKNQKITVTTHLRVFFASKEKFMEKMRNHIADMVIEEATREIKSDYLTIYTGSCRNSQKLKRGMDTIFTNNNEHTQLLDSIKAFIANKHKYKSLAYPYKFSALLYGKPGCGKSSCILAIASALGKNIMYINLAKTSIERMMDKINAAGQQDILVFEDIDALSTPVAEARHQKVDNNKSEDEIDDIFKPYDECDSIISKGVSLSDILNFTDGLLASDGTICLFTTNHKEKLDPAFLRAGRMDKLVEFENFKPETSARMLKHNLDWDVPAERLKDGINPAELQSMILNILLGKATKEDLTAKFFK